jgi:anti-sigma factor RsiW
MTDTTDPRDANARRFGPATEGPARGHFGDLKLRQMVAGELQAEEQEVVSAHVAACVGCGRRAESVRAEQGAFERQISFDRFAAGVERAARVPAPAPASRWWARPA